MSRTPNTSHSSYLQHIRVRDLPSSAFLTYPLTTNFMVNLSSPIHCMQNETIAVSLHSLTLPCSFYNVTEYNNQFQFSPDAGITWVSITIPSQNYTVKSLATILQALLLNVSPIGSTMTITYISATNTFTFVSNLNFKLDFRVTNSLNIQTGFDKDIYSSVGGFLQSVNSVSLTPYYSVYLHTDLVQANTLDTFGRLSDIMERVNIVSMNNVLYYRPQTQHTFLISKKSISSFRIRLTFENDIPINLNGLYPEISLQFFIISGLDRPLPDLTRPSIDIIEDGPQNSE